MENVTLHDLNVIFTDILQEINDRYISRGFTIPRDVLQFKDEAYDIIKKAAGEQNSKAFEGYKQRLTEIYEILHDPIGQ